MPLKRSLLTRTELQRRKWSRIWILVSLQPECCQGLRYWLNCTISLMSGVFQYLTLSFIDGAMVSFSNPSVLPFNSNLFAWTSVWCCLFLKIIQKGIWIFSELSLPLLVFKELTEQVEIDSVDKELLPWISHVSADVLLSGIKNLAFKDLHLLLHLESCCFLACSTLWLITLGRFVVHVKILTRKRFLLMFGLFRCLIQQWLLYVAPWSLPVNCILPVILLSALIPTVD